MQKKISSLITIGLICVFGFVLWRILPLLPPILWPGGIGIGKDKSVTTTTVETDKQGKTLKKVTITAYSDGKTLWDWGSLLGVPLSLAILGYILQEQQRKRADNETKEEVLQNYLDRLSVLLIDKNLIWLLSKSNSSTTTPKEPEPLDSRSPKITSIALSNTSNLSTITHEERELLDSSLNLIQARTLSILRRFENDAERTTRVIKFLVESEIIGKSKLNLLGAEIQEAELQRAYLKGAYLKGAYLKKAYLQEANLQGANLERANLIEAILEGANLIEAELEEAELQGAYLKGANLQGANLQRANLQRAKLEGAKLEGAILEGANLIEAELEEAELEGAELQGACLTGANLQRANLQRAKLQRAKLEGAKLEGANLQGANLQGANPIEAKLEGANLQEANLQGADLNDIKWDSKTVWPYKNAFTYARNIPEKLKKELGITP